MNAIPTAKPQPELTIGLVNNMPAAACAATDRQFCTLLDDAAPGCRIRLRRFALDPVPAGYEPLDQLWKARLDGLIVTGAEPQADAMTDEPSWDLLARLVDWAADRSTAAIWSCLAAHAAAFRLDGIERRRLPSKLSGVFPCRRATTHPLIEATSQAWLVPHSRWNDLDAAALERAGYTILSEINDGADACLKRVGDSVFLLLQGHPEYAADTLRREYRRDLRRWLAGASRPESPMGYFDPVIETALAQAADPLACLDLLETAPDPAATWRAHGVRLFQNWLTMLSAPTLIEAGLAAP